MIPDIIQWMFDSYPNFAECAIQIFSDDASLKYIISWKDWKPNKVVDPNACILPNTEATYNKLVDMNKKWCWIFFSINSMIPWERDKKGVTKINVWVCEVDWTSKETQQKLIKKCPIHPSLIIESKSSYHMYWFAKDGTKENWIKICSWLRNYFDWDEKVSGDISRVLRLPWYCHMKNKDDPYEITLYDWTNEYYTEQQMLLSFPDHRPLTQIKKDITLQDQKAEKIIWSTFWTRVKSMNAKVMLEEISWHSFVKWDIFTFSKNSDWSEQIYVNWLSTSNAIHDWRIGSSSWWWPHWTNRVFWYNQCDGSQLAKWIKEKHPEMCEMKDVPQPKIKKDIWITTDTIDLDLRWYKPSWWLDYMDREFRKMDKYWELIVIFWPPWCWKTEFGFFVAKGNKENLKTVYFCLEIPEQTILKRRALRKRWYTWEDIDYNRLTNEQEFLVQNDLNRFKAESKKYLTMISISQSPTIEQLIDKMESEYTENILYIIDNLGKIQWNDDENKRFEEITSKLQTFAYGKKCWIILQHHTVKPPPKKDKDIENVFAQSLFWPYWFRGSQKIFDNATRLIEIHRDYANNKTLMMQYKHTPTDTRWFVWLSFEQWDYREYL